MGNIFSTKKTHIISIEEYKCDLKQIMIKKKGDCKICHVKNVDGTKVIHLIENKKLLYVISAPKRLKDIVIKYLV